MPTLCLKSGEEHKNLVAVEKIWAFYQKNHCSRNTLSIHLGGGVLGDLGGFAAATFKRGMPFLHIPTTLLSMVDAAIGGKTGFNYGKVKNLIGAFQMPEAIAVEPAFLKTLPNRFLASGYAEIFKHALIADADLWQKLIPLKQADIPEMSLIQKAQQTKLHIVAEDPEEKGCRKLLNYGHTIGHALEAISQTTAQPLQHGEAIAIGMQVENQMACELGHLDKAACQAINTKLQSFFPRKYALTEAEWTDFLFFIQNDKKNRGKELNFTFLEGVGKGIYDVGLPLDKAEQLLRKIMF